MSPCFPHSGVAHRQFLVPAGSANEGSEEFGRMKGWI